VFSGSGGQGVITAAIILAEAAVMYDGKNATQSQSYGAAARGGGTRSDIIISNEEINFPEVRQPNVLVCLTQDAYNTYSSIVRPGGLLLTDTKFVKTTKKVDARQVELPLYQEVMSKIGKPVVFNICVLGALVGITEVVRPKSVMSAVADRVPRDFLELNNEALDLGFTLGAESQ
jgi:2-oxoglutarate ferredoxin oxidoreductase subunit gamma